MKKLELLFLLGRPLAPLYSLIMRLRAYCYASGLKKVEQLTTLVISVGNLTMGGTGKTPMVLYLARLTGETFKPAIISRGYGGTAKGPVNIVSDRSRILLPAEEAGDEPHLLAVSLPGVPVLTGPRRVLSGRAAIAQHGADLLIMDDGFQHMALHRDLNIALFSASALLDNGRVFPGGPLREPIDALERAHCFVFTGVTPVNRDNAEIFAQALCNRFPGTPCFFGEYRVSGFYNPESGETVEPHNFQGLPLLAFCGIATPASFQASLEGLGLKVSEFHTFADHHRFTAMDIRNLEEAASRSGCAAMVCTTKDQVKLSGFKGRLPRWVLQMDLVMEPGFDRFVLEYLNRAHSS